MNIIMILEFELMSEFFAPSDQLTLKVVTTLLTCLRLSSFHVQDGCASHSFRTLGLIFLPL